jgi:hypothetical protein
MKRHRKAINSVSNTILLSQTDKLKLKYYVKKNHSIYTDIKHLTQKVSIQTTGCACTLEPTISSLLP